MKRAGVCTIMVAVICIHLGAVIDSAEGQYNWCGFTGFCFQEGYDSINGGWGCLDIHWTTGDVEQLLACSSTSATSIWYVPCNGNPGGPYYSHAYESHCSVGTWTEAYVCIGASDRGYLILCCYAATSTPSQTYPETHVETIVSHDDYFCYPNVRWPIGITGGWAATDYNFSYTPDKGGRSDDWTAAFQGAFTDPVYDPNYSETKLTRLVAIFDDGSAQPVFDVLMYAGDLVNPGGMIFGQDPVWGTDVWQYEISIGGGAGDYNLSTKTRRFDDEQMDTTGYLELDSEGRFNEADVEAMELYLVGSTDPNDLDYWDFDVDDDIDSEDVAVLQELIDLGLDSGFFGDLDGDGTPDCDDKLQIGDTFIYDLEDAEYRVELDYDLDGDNDDDDRSVFMDDVCPWSLGDLNCDGELNSLDISPFMLVLTGTPPEYPEYYAEYEDCDHMLADCNEDGSLNTLDIDSFVDLLTGG